MVLVIEQSGNDKEREKSLLALLVLLNHWVPPSPQDLQGAKKKLPLKDLWKKRYMYMYTSDTIIQNICQVRIFLSISISAVIGEFFCILSYTPFRIGKNWYKNFLLSNTLDTCTSSKIVAVFHKMAVVHYVDVICVIYESPHDNTAARVRCCAGS